MACGDLLKALAKPFTDKPDKKLTKQVKKKPGCSRTDRFRTRSGPKNPNDNLKRRSKTMIDHQTSNRTDSKMLKKARR